VTLRDFYAVFVTDLSRVYEPSELKNIYKWLISARLNLTPVELVRALNEPLNRTQGAQLKNDLNRLSSGEPLQYVLGSTEFCSLLLKCSSSALIPRPETEELVCWILEENEFQCCHLLDIGTGTGCIPLSIKHKRPSWQVAALDCSEEALALARENAIINALDCHWINYDILQDDMRFPLCEPLDIVVSNPPYIPWNEKEELSPRVKDFEPSLALFVPDEDPLIFYRKIVEFSLRYGSPNVKVYFEIHEKLAQEVYELFRVKAFANIELRKDLQGKERMIKAHRLSL